MNALKICESYTTPQQNETCLEQYIKSKRYLELLGWTVFGVGIALLGSSTPLRKRNIPYQKTSSGDVIRDQEINQPFIEESISSVQAALIAVVAPLVIQVAFALLIRKDRADVHHTWCAYALAFGLVLCTVETLKNHVGRLRPNTYEYCGWDDALLACTSKEDDWRKSFPSGHSATSFTGATLLVFYLWYAVDLSYRRALAWRIWMVVSLAPFVVAFVVASSRLVENYHHPADVVFGAVIGTSSALVSTYIHFPIKQHLKSEENEDEHTDTNA